MINPYPDYPTSKQDAFDRVWNWFVVEKHKPGVDDAGGCAYRGIGGCMCGIGVMVPDADMPENAIGSIEVLIDCDAPFADKLLDRFEEDADFLCAVQESHDSAYKDSAKGDADFHSLIESSLRSVAEEYDLSVPSNQGTP